MSHDRRLIDTIKQHFARKTSAQLQEVVQANDPERWSAEAMAAAQEVLLDRAAGRSEEPLVGEEDPPPPTRHDLDRIALIVGANVFTLPMGILVFPKISARAPADDPIARDQPIPFGSKIAWLAVATTETAEVAAALDLQGSQEATWAEGIAAAYRSSVFVTPPLGEWTLAVSTALFLFPRNDAEAFVKPILEELSRRFGEAQFFCTHRDLELYIWARAQEGRLIRGYGWLGENGVTLWDEGAPTKDELDLGFRFEPGRPPTVPAEPNEPPAPLDESCVQQLACLWSIDPSALDEQLKEPVQGLLGVPPWSES
jgi:hypothetical protein